jgi:hypothetical protein
VQPPTWRWRIDRQLGRISREAAAGYLLEIGGTVEDIRRAAQKSINAGMPLFVVVGADLLMVQLQELLAHLHGVADRAARA